MATKKAKTAREALLMAADLLSKRGAWHKGAAFDALKEPKATAWCVWGAILHVTGGGTGNRVECAASNRLNCSLGLSAIDDLFEWNDAQKSKTPVIRALRKAAEAQS